VALLTVALAAADISAFYYLRVVKRIYLGWVGKIESFDLVKKRVGIYDEGGP
jgi:NADH:ubiquinone oxidoreductase subunit 2 (subunit N)